MGALSIESIANFMWSSFYTLGFLSTNPKCVVYFTNVIWLQTGKKHDKNLMLGPCTKRLIDVLELLANLFNNLLMKVGVVMIHKHIHLFDYMLAPSRLI